MSDVIQRLNAALSGRYRIERQLGEGGMATVYLADDLKHGRKVALKVLKPELAAVIGAERFLAEIKTTASLQHPHILPLHDSGEADGLLFYVMPHVEGESLRERLDREHQLPVDAAVRIATDMAEALDYAHRHGVVHRDIKPANVLLVDGRPVIADFGIALAVSASGAGRLTETGLSLGTPHYMSPEQATGDQTVGPATDTWALGCVLYEMLVGEPPYTGSTPQAILGRIIAGEPVPVREHRKSVPENVIAAIAKALEKLPVDRFGAASQLAKALGDRGFRHGEARNRAEVPRVEPSIVAATSLAVGVLLTAVVLRGPGTGTTADEPNEAPSIRATIDLPAEAPLALGLGVPPYGYSSPVLALSPDGRRLAYVARSASGRILYARDLATGRTQALEGTEGAIHAFFSPDGESIGFLTEDRVKRINWEGGVATTLAEATTAVLGWWLQDDMIYYTEPENFGLSSVPASGGRATQVLTAAQVAEAGLGRLSDLLPDASGVIATRAGGIGGDHLEVVLFDLTTSQVQPLLRFGFGARVVSPGYLLFGRAGSLMAVQFDLERRATRGEPVTVAPGAMVESLMGILHSASSNNGLLAYASGSDLSVGGLTWVDRAGNSESLRLTERVYGALDLSPDQNRIAVEVADVQDQVLVWDVARAEGRLVVSSQAQGVPTWSVDGRQLVSAILEPPFGLSIHAVDASGAVGPGTQLANSSRAWGGMWSPDGSVIAMSTNNGVIEFEGARGPVDVAPIERAAFPGFSPDGRWLAYQSGRTGTEEVWIRSFPDGQEDRQVSSGGGVEPRWKPSGDLYFRNAGRWYATRVSTDGEVRWEPPRLVFETDFIDTPGMSYDVSADGRRLLVVKRAEPLPPVLFRVEIVTNWRALVETARLGSG